MPKRARVHFISLHSSLVNLPVSIYGPLVERNVRPQHLAVHLILFKDAVVNPRVEAYVGWTGMASASSLEHFNANHRSDVGFETVEIDPQFAQGLGLSQGDVVEIGLLHDLPHAKSVGAEPLTSDDWEIIEIHSSHIESTLLSQVRVAKIGQEVDVWVLGRTRVRLRVTSLDPASKGNAALLTTNTEVSIAPKLHKRKETTFTEQSISSESQSQLARKSNIDVLRVLPARLASFIGHTNHSGPELLAFVSSKTLSLLQSHSSDLDSSTFLPASFKRLQPPVNPSSSASDPSPNEFLHTTKISDVADLYIGVVEGIMDNHIVFFAQPNVVEEWDLVRVSLLTGGETLRLEPPQHPQDLSSKPHKLTFLAGIDEVLDRCTKFCIREFLIQSLRKSCHGFSGLLVTGPSGAGKTSIVRRLAKLLEEDKKTLTYTHYVDVSKLSEKPISTVRAEFDYWFDKCAWHMPSVLILDNLDKVLSAEVEHAESFRSRQLTALFLRNYSSMARTATRNSRGILLIATAHSTTSLHSFINSAHVFKEVVNLTPPTKQARRLILEKLILDRLYSAGNTVVLSSDIPVNFVELATQTEGFSAADLTDLVTRAFHQLVIRALSNLSTKNSPLELTHQDFVVAQADFIPLSLRNVRLEKSNVSWSDIGGLYETRRVLRETLEWPTKYGPIFKQAPLRLRSGLLLYGYPGCGKTLLASAVAKECGLNFISIKGPEILNKYIGASEKSVRDLFERADAAKPCVLFFDEFDSIAPKRGHDSTGVTDRVVNQLLTQMDGAEGLDGVYILAATSRPDLIDSALLRPGRLDKSLLCDMPDFGERQDILKAVASKLVIAPDVDFAEVALKTEGFSGADLQALLYNAHLDVIHSAIAEAPTTTNKPDEVPLEYMVFDAEENQPAMSKAEQTDLERKLRQILINSSNQIQSKVKTTSHKKEIRQDNVLKALKTTRPSISFEERNRLTRIYEGFLSGRTAMHPVPPEAGGIGHRVTLG